MVNQPQGKATLGSDDSVGWYQCRWTGGGGKELCVYWWTGKNLRENPDETDTRIAMSEFRDFVPLTLATQPTAAEQREYELPDKPGIWMRHDKSEIIVREWNRELEYSGWINIGRMMGKVKELPRGGWWRRGASPMRYLLATLICLLGVTSFGQSPGYEGNYKIGSIEYRTAKAEARTAARRASERVTWERIKVRQEMPKEDRAAAKLRIAYLLLKLGKLEASDRWMTEIADNFPNTTAGQKAKFELGR